MAERIVVPGVYAREKDQSFLPAAARTVGAAVIGPTLKGPALVPTTVTSFSEFQQTFGSFTNDSYVPLTVNEYLRNGNTITVTRLLYEDGYNLDNGVLAVIATSASVEAVTHILHPVEAVNSAADLLASSSLADDVSGIFAISLSGSYTANINPDIVSAFTLYPTTNTPVSASIVQSDSNYITKVFGNSAKSTDYPVYVQYENKKVSELFADMADVTTKLAIISAYDFVQDFKAASTPWITSQKIGSSAIDLFRFHTLSHGDISNYETKVVIREIKLSTETPSTDEYGSFVVEVRKVATSNFPPKVKEVLGVETLTNDLLESFVCNLNPNSANYIANKIGTRYTEVDNNGNVLTYGDYVNKSKYIRVEVTNAVQNAQIDESLVPFGSRALYSTIPNPSGSANFVAATYVTAQTNTTTLHGFDYNNSANVSYLSSIPTTGFTTGSNADFYLGDVSQSSAVSSVYTGSLQSALTGGTFSNVLLTTRNFTVALQGGFDGARPNLPKFSGDNITADNTFGFDCSGATTTGTVAYKKAMDVLNNPDVYDMNLLLTPGIIENLHAAVTNYAINLAEDRQDTFYIADLVALSDNVDEVISRANGIDSSYVATYYPWVGVNNPLNGSQIWIPASVAMAGVITQNDRLEGPWYAPAGLNRGGVSANLTKFELNPKQKAALYEARVNPIANLASLGIAVWGQKTLQARPSALDRVNVRRLLIHVKKYIASATKYLVFDQNTDVTRQNFVNIVNPYLAQIKSKQGLYAFRVIMDDTNNTPDLIDQNIMYGQIFLQPTRTAEFIILDFNIQPTGAAFPA